MRASEGGPMFGMSRLARAVPAVFTGRKLVAVATIALIPLVFATSAAHAADPAVRVSVGTVTLTDRVLLTVRVAIVFAPLPNTPVGDGVSVDVAQPSGNQVNHGTCAAASPSGGGCVHFLHLDRVKP